MRTHLSLRNLYVIPKITDIYFHQIHLGLLSWMRLTWVILQVDGHQDVISVLSLNCGTRQRGGVNVIINTNSVISTSGHKVSPKTYHINHLFCSSHLLIILGMGSVLSKKKSKDSKYAVKKATSYTTQSSNNSFLTDPKGLVYKQQLKNQRPSSMPPNTIQTLPFEKINTSRSTLSTAPTSVLNHSLTNSSVHTAQNKSSYNNEETTSSFIHQSHSFYLPDDWDSKEYQYNVMQFIYYYAKSRHFNELVAPFCTKKIV